MLFEVDDSVLKEIEIRKQVIRFIEEEYGARSELSPVYGIDLFTLYDSRWDDELVGLILELEGVQEAEASATVEHRVRTLEKLEKRFHERMQEIRLKRR